ncbi:hypothetical protein SAMN05216503_0759 [Polaribacter sp. KT25b]|uniref:hypothetical protein n=1 Tax=Polaribacter sp. KT25b TaxID=1855336 RepID=UPI00087C63F9|nr:hypothetical protein [Polaribacter sp. KT25b]SDR75455.1 hypothetical protein SAMN05216503_0759 [Polaribacter sp. KT25b]
MKKLLLYYFIFSIITGAFIYFSSHLNIQLPRFVRHYVNDFLIIPIILFISLQVLKWSKNDTNYTLSIWVILYLCLMYSVLFEFIFPEYLARYTKDFIDIILYFASGLIFYYLQKTKNEF